MHLYKALPRFKGMRAKLSLLFLTSIVSHIAAQSFDTSQTLAACDLSPFALVSAQASCSLKSIPTPTTIQPNEVVTVPFINLNPTIFQGTSFGGWSSKITATNPKPGASQTIFFLFGVCSSSVTASACASSYFNYAKSNIPVLPVCSSSCALSGSSDAIVLSPDVSQWKNPQYTTVSADSISVSSIYSVANSSTLSFFAGKDDAQKFGSGYVFFMGSLSTIPITVNLTLLSVSTGQSYLPPSPPSPPSLPSGSSSKLSSGAIAGIVIGAVVGVIIIAVIIFLVLKRKPTRVSSQGLPVEEPPQAKGV